MRKKSKQNFLNLIISLLDVYLENFTSFEKYMIESKIKNSEACLDNVKKNTLEILE